MSVVTLAGWGQPHDALREVAPKARHLDYSSLDSLEEVFGLLSRHAKNASAVIGWSMGGQLALRAAAQGIISPDKMVLIATPYQFKKMPHGGIGMDHHTFTQFRENFMRSRARTLSKSYALIAHGDVSHKVVTEKLTDVRSRLLHDNWLPWFDLMGDFQGDTLDMSAVTDTLLIHGENDAVIEPAQSRRLQEKLPKSTLVSLPGCGHAPHLHDTPKVKQLIEEFLA